MNIFKKTNDFIREPYGISKQATVKNILELTEEIKKRLDNKGYLMDKYLSLILEAVNQTLCHEAATDGFESGSSLRRLCTAILNHDAAENLPFYEKAKELADEHPLEFQEKCTKVDIYFCLLADKYLDYVLEETTEEWVNKVSEKLDVIYLNELYKTISAVVGESDLEQLNLLIRQRFFSVLPAQAFAQGFTNDLLYCLNHRDVETGKLVWELIGE